MEAEDNASDVDGISKTDAMGLDPTYPPTPSQERLGTNPLPPRHPPADANRTPQNPMAASGRVFAYSVSAEDRMIDPEDEEFMYPFSYAHPGLAVIITYSQFNGRFEERRGATVDKAKMEEAFMGLGFQVESLHNLNTLQLMQKLNTLAKSDLLKHVGCFACVISSHGSENEIGKEERDSYVPDNVAMYDHFITTRDSQVRTREIMQQFDNDHCSNLSGKPRLFFIQACRSRFDPDNPILNAKAFDEGVQVDVQIDKEPGVPPPNLNPDLTHIQPSDVGYSEISEAHQESSAVSQEISGETSMDARGTMAPVIKQGDKMFYEHTAPKIEKTIPLVPPVCLNHFLVMFASISETVGWSDNRGGWLLSNLHDVFKQRIEQQSRFSLMKALVDVNRKVAYDKTSNTHDIRTTLKKSMPCLESKLSKEVFLDPAVWPGSRIVN